MLLGNSLGSFFAVFGDVGGLLSDEKLNVTMVGEISGDSSVGSESSSSSLGGSVDLDVSNGAVLAVESLSLGVGFSISEEGHDVVDRFLRPSTGGHLEFFSLSSSTDSEMISEWNNSSVSKNVLEISLSNLQVHSSDGVCDLISIFVTASDISGGSIS